MTWLVTHMWIVLAAASLMGLLLGWSVRGILLSGKMRQAIVERDMVKVELSNSKEEVEKLFGQIRKLQGSDTQASSAAPDPILTRKLESLTAELARKSAEIEALRASTGTALPVQAPMAPPAALSETHADDELLWRNRRLESRVTHLEAELAAARSTAAPAAGSVTDARTAWELSYLRTRVEGLQAEITAAPAVVAAATDAGPVEEELARLRWRVRFLEGRVAYFEGDQTEAAASPAEPPAPRAAEAILGQLEAEDQRAEEEARTQIAKVQPLALDKPFAGTPDDLTLIGGIGPKIQELLNKIGIYHFDQIAEWKPEHVAWVDERLGFSGRITREGWVEQAAVLVGETSEA